jgi:hypothetical protein
MSLAVEALRSDVAAVGELGDDAVADAAERVAAVLTRSVPVRLLEVLSEVAADVSAELPDGRVEVRLAGDDVDLVYVAEELQRPQGGDADAELSARITLRLSESLKTHVEADAARDGLSVNAFIVRALERGTARRTTTSTRGGTRIRGYGST